MPDLNRTQPADPPAAESIRTDSGAQSPDGTQVGSADDHRRTAALANPELTGRYHLREEIARGGMGAVYRATDTILKREVAIKVLQDRFGSTSAAARRFADEAHIAGQLQHPGIPPVHDLGTLPDGRPFLAMKLIKGDTLAEILASRERESSVPGEPGASATGLVEKNPLTHVRGSPRAAPNLLAIFEAICQAVGYAHAHSVVHRDLKPANVMVGSFGEVQVMDWGLAKVLGERPADSRPSDLSENTPTEIRGGHDSDATGTQAGTTLGTPAYMPPEQAIGAIDQIDERSDVFGLGAVLCAILTGQPPYVGDTAESTRQLAARAKLDDAFARLDACGAEPELVALCKRCLSVEKADRPRHAGEVAKAVAALRQAADERAKKAELDRVRAEGEQAKAEAEAREQRKRRKVQLALAASLLLLAGLGGLGAWWWGRVDSQRKAVAFQQQLDDERRAGEERSRLARNGDALAALVGQCEKALKADDADAAEAALTEIDRRLPEGGGEALAGRIARCRTDHELLVELNHIDQFRWTPVVDNKLPARVVVATKWREAFARFGIEPGSPAEAANRISPSWVRDRLLTALDLWLRAEPSAGVRAILAAADPDPYRDAVRDAVLATEATRVVELATQPEALAQPPGFAAALGQSRDIPVARRRTVLGAALRARPGDLTLLMTMGDSYPFGQREGAEERGRWFQAAVAAHPRNVTAYNSLGLALGKKGNLDGAVECYREAIRHDPKFAPVHTNLGIALASKGDLDGAIACYREAIRLDPTLAKAHTNLGAILCDVKKDYDGAIACFREALKIDPKDVPAHYNLGVALGKKGNLDGAVECYREALKHAPKNIKVHVNLGIALASKGDVDGSIDAFREALKHAPKNAQVHTNLGAALASKGDLDGAIVCFREAVRLDPKNPNWQKNLDIALKFKAERDEKEGRIAPPPREVKR